MTDARKALAELADEIEQSDGIALMLTGVVKQIGIRRTAMVIAALRAAAQSSGVRVVCAQCGQTLSPDTPREGE